MRAAAGRRELCGGSGQEDSCRLPLNGRDESNVLSERKGCVMRLLAEAAALTAVLLLAAQAAGQEAPRKPHPALAPIEDDPALPRVLLIGDSISMGYTLPVRELLQGKANVHRVPANAGPTIRGLKALPKWLRDGRWDVIHFNWGLHDLRRDENDKHQVPLDEYEKNLRELVRQLRATGAKLIWASTTPVPEGELAPPRTDADVIAYNAVAARIMQENEIDTDDLYAVALPKLAELQRPANVHFTPKGSRVLGEAVAKCIEARLGGGTAD